MNADKRLERRYRLLLLAYPRWYRRERQDEILTTLLDAAAPAQRWPRWRETADIVTRGVRRRFSVPRGPGYRVVAGALAVICALGAGAAVSAVAWRGAARQPDDSVALAAARDATPANPLAKHRTSEIVPGSFTNAADPSGPPSEWDPGPTSVEFAYALPHGGMAGVVPQVRDRLTARGWTVLQPNPHAQWFWAARDDQIIRVAWSSPATEAGHSLWISVYRHAPRWIGAAVTAAAVVGLVLGWLFAGWALRAFQRHGLRGRAAMVVLGVPGLFGAVLAVMYAAATLALVTVVRGWHGTDTRYLVTAVVELAPLILPAGSCLFGAVAIALAPPAASVHRPRTTAARSWQYLSWGAASVHLAIAVAWLTVIVAYAAQPGLTGGERLGGAHDPKDLVPFGPSPLNPFMWAFDIVLLLVLFGFLISPAFLAVSIPLLASGRRVHTATAVMTRRLLLVAAATALAIPGLTFTPLGHDILAWLLD